MDETLVIAEIRKEIAARGLKVGFLAKKIGVAPCTLSSYLTGKRNLGLPAKISLFRELNISEALMKKAS